MHVFQNTTVYDHVVGQTLGEPDSSWASAYWDETGFVSSVVHLGNNSYVIEVYSLRYSSINVSGSRCFIRLSSFVVNSHS